MKEPRKTRCLEMLEKESEDLGKFHQEGTEWRAILEFQALRSLLQKEARRCGAPKLFREPECVLPLSSDLGSNYGTA